MEKFFEELKNYLINKNVNKKDINLICGFIDFDNYRVYNYGKFVEDESCFYVNLDSLDFYENDCEFYDELVEKFCMENGYEFFVD